MLHLEHGFLFGKLFRVLTTDTLMKKRWPMVNRCILCKENEESVDYILIYCDKTRVLRTFC